MTNAQMTPEQIVRRYYQLINDRQLDSASALVDQHAVYHYLPTRQRFVGRTGFYELMAFWLNAFKDAKLEVLSVLPLTDHVVQIEFLGTGTHTGDFVLDEGCRFPPTGRVQELPFRNLLEIHNGIITGVELDFDVEEMKRRLAGGAAQTTDA